MLLLSREDIKKVFTIKDAIEADKKALAEGTVDYIGFSYYMTNVVDSTVHKDVSERLEKIQPALYMAVKEVLEMNKKERHIRGGMATKLKYEQIALKKKKCFLAKRSDKKQKS